MVGCITCSLGECFLDFQCVAIVEEGIIHKMIQPNLYRRRPCSLAGLLQFDNEWQHQGKNQKRLGGTTGLPQSKKHGKVLVLVLLFNPCIFAFCTWMFLFVGLAYYQGNDIVLRFIIECISLRDFGPQVIIIGKMIFWLVET